MHLHAAFIPPAEVQRALVDLVTRQEPTPGGASAPQSGRGFFRRSTPEPAAPTGPLLDVAQADDLVLPITDFRSVASGDARRLVDALSRVCAELPPGPTVQVSGGSALVDPDDRSVWAELAATDEDVDALRTAAQSVVSAVEPLGFFCDRRQFRPRFALATINDATTVEHLEQVLDALSAYRSEPWNVTEVAILERRAGVWRTIPIGG